MSTPSPPPPPGLVWAADGTFIFAHENARRLRLETLARSQTEAQAEAAQTTRSTLAALDAHASDPQPANWPSEPVQSGEQSWILREREAGVMRDRLELLTDKKAQLGRELDRITTARLRGEPTPEGGRGSVAVQFRRVEL